MSSSKKMTSVSNFQLLMPCGLPPIHDYTFIIKTLEIET